MNDTHKACISNNMIDSLCILLSGEVKYQKVYVPGGPTRRRIIIEHDHEYED